MQTYINICLEVNRAQKVYPVLTYIFASVSV